MKTRKSKAPSANGRSPSESTSLQDKFAAAREAMSNALIERDAEIDLVLTALIAGEHVLLIGDPGTAKSLLLDTVMSWAGGTRFKVLLTKFTEPDEVLGPTSLKGLKDDQYRRVITGMLPEAEYAFLDEALSLNTPILTTQGWKCFGDLKVGDYVFGTDGNPTKVTAMTPINRNGDCYKIRFRDGSKITADAGHKWKVINEGGTVRVMTTEEIYRRIKTRKSAGQVVRHKTPKPAPVNFPTADLPIDPYILGLWLGNGNRWNGEIYIRDCWYEETMKEIHRAYTNTLEGKKIGEHLISVSMSGTGFRTKLRELGLIESQYYSSKHVPEQYLTASVHQRLELLRGLMDTDGYCDSSGTCVFVNTNRSMIDAVAFIVRSLGTRCTVKGGWDGRYGKNGKHKECWKVTFRADPEMSPFKARDVKIPDLVYSGCNSIASIKPCQSVPVRCITVDAEDHLFLAGKSLIPTHNCFKASSAILNTLLTLLNEREFKNGSDGIIKCPLRLCVAASNEWPNEENGGAELGALFDRFLFRKTVKPVSPSTGRRELFKAALDNSRCKAVFPEPITALELDRATEAAKLLPWSKEAMASLREITNALDREGVGYGDRRFYKSINAVRAYAWLNRAEQVLPQHLEVLQHVLWEDPIEQPAKAAKVILRLCNPGAVVLEEIETQANDVIDKCKPHEAIPKLQDLAVSVAKLCGVDMEVASSLARSNCAALAAQAEKSSKNPKATKLLKFLAKTIRFAYSKAIGEPKKDDSGEPFIDLYAGRK